MDDLDLVDSACVVTESTTRRRSLHGVDRMNEMPNIPEVVLRYFERDAERDIDGIVALFTEDATVTDERATHRGTDEIRAWQLGPASRYEYRTEILGGEEFLPDRYVVTGRLTGNLTNVASSRAWSQRRHAARRSAHARPKPQ